MAGLLIQLGKGKPSRESEPESESEYEGFGSKDADLAAAKKLIRVLGLDIDAAALLKAWSLMPCPEMMRQSESEED